MASQILRDRTRRNPRILTLFLDGTGTAAISGRDADLFTLTDNGTGDYTLTATTAFSEVPYVSVISATVDVVPYQVAPTTTVINIKMRSVADSPAAADADMYVAIYCDQGFAVSAEV